MQKKIKTIAQILISIFPNKVKLALYRILFSSNIGKGARIGFGAILIFDNLIIGDDVKISPLCIVKVKELHIGIRSKIGLFSRVIAHTVNLGASVTIGPQVSILATDSDPRCIFTAGAETWIFEYCYINPARPIRLGRNVGVGGGSYIFAHGLWLSKLKGYPVNFSEINIGNDVWLPWGCFVMPGVTIGDGAVVGARSVITKDVPSGSLVAGTPARLLKSTVALNISIEQQIEYIKESIIDFCQQNKFEFNFKHEPDWIIFEIDNRTEIVVSNNQRSSPTKIKYDNALHIVHDSFSSSHKLAKAVFSTSSFQCSPRSSFSVIQGKWLQHLRQIGTRHYPIDETRVE